MTTQEIVNKLWNLCNVLRDDGITYHQYVTELTYILFLKMAEETGQEERMGIPEGYRWADLKRKEGLELNRFYKELLLHLGSDGKGKVQQIFSNAQTSINKPANLQSIIKSIDDLDWFSAREDGLGDLYEGLLEKNATETKSGAGQYFTPRPLINSMVRLLDPKVGERCNDPACGTFGFMIAASEYLREKTNDYFDLPSDQAEFQINKAFTGSELVPDTHRLALMNALLHGINGDVRLMDTLSSEGEELRGFDVVLANPPFGTKRGGENAHRSDFTIKSSNKQLNFLYHIYLSMKKDGKSRAAVVLPDNVLFQDGDGQKIRADLMEKCNLHTILRLPTGIFYAQGVKTNVLFFNRGTNDKNNTKSVWIYDMRTNMPNFGKRTPFTEAYFKDFELAYAAADRAAVQDERWNCFSREQIKAKNDSLDLGLIADDSLVNYDELPEPVDIAGDAMELLQGAMADLQGIIDNLKK